MKKILLLSVILLLSCFVHAQDKKVDPNYDEALAKKLGADDNGMKNLPASKKVRKY